MPQTAYYAHQAQTTLPPPAPTKIISSHFAHLSNIRTLAHAKGYIESARISSHRQLWGKNQKKGKFESSLSIKGPFNVQCRFYLPANQETFSALFAAHQQKTQPTTLSSSDSFNFNLLYGQEKTEFLEKWQKPENSPSDSRLITPSPQQPRLLGKYVIDILWLIPSWLQESSITSDHKLMK